MQKICPEDEWDNFVTTLKSDLPSSFRITATSNAEATELLKFVEGVLLTDLLRVERSDENELKSSKPFCLPWFVYFKLFKYIIYYY